MNSGYPVTTGTGSPAIMSVSSLAKMSKVCCTLCQAIMYKYKILVSLHIGSKR